jgi:hypothetical protein
MTKTTSGFIVDYDYDIDNIHNEKVIDEMIDDDDDDDAGFIGYDDDDETRTRWRRRTNTATTRTARTAGLYRR